MRYPPLIANYLSYCRYRHSCQSKGKLDFRSENFFHPGLLLPLANLIKQNKQVECHYPASPPVARYLEMMSTDTASDEGGDTYCPFVSFPKEQAVSYEVIQRLFRILDDGKKCGGESAFKYVIGELRGNIYEHSRFKNANVMGQSYNSKKYTEICFYDDGRSIPGVFEDHDITFPNDDKAIIAATQGQSTKPEDGRGWGLGSSICVLIEELRGQLIIVSRQGLVYLDGSRSEGIIKASYILDKELAHQGTMINMRIPFTSKRVDVSLFANRRIKW